MDNSTIKTENKDLKKNKSLKYEIPKQEPVCINFGVVVKDPKPHHPL